MKQTIRQQAGNPAGLLGRLFGWTMNVFNRADNRWTIDLLNLQPTDKLLEVGFGTGQAIEYAAEKITQGQIVGVDHSQLKEAGFSQVASQAGPARRFSVFCVTGLA
jgi:cyclopropane fatty-acyl-phospholipid synthase-like methyltransferase